MKAVKQDDIYSDFTGKKADVFVKPWILIPAIALLVLAILSRLPYEFHRLLISSTELGAIDLIQRYEEVQLWFSGEHVYSLLNSAVYPPASYLIMWPFMGFSAWSLVRWIWAISSIILLGILTSRIIVDHAINKPLERTFWSLFILAHYATGITIGNGQLTIHIMGTLAVSMALFTAHKTSWKSILLGGLLAALSLIKPTVTAPFMWLVLFVPRNLYPALFTGIIYTILAVIASSFQKYGIFQLHLDWLSLGLAGATWSSTVGSQEGLSDSFSKFSAVVGTIDWSELLGGDVGYADIHSILGVLGMSQWALPTSLMILALLGVWVYVYRYCNVSTLLGVAAIVSRIWTYHRVYDDMLIIFAIFAVVSILKRGVHSWNKQPGRILLVALIIASLVPSSLRLLPYPLDLVFKLGQFTLWIMTLLYLLYSAYLENKNIIKNSESAFS